MSEPLNINDLGLVVGEAYPPNCYIPEGTVYWSGSGGRFRVSRGLITIEHHTICRVHLPEPDPKQFGPDGPRDGDVAFDDETGLVWQAYEGA